VHNRAYSLEINGDNRHFLIAKLKSLVVEEALQSVAGKRD
jgi:hypothetical protein